MNPNLYLIRKDLRNGMSIETVCNKYNITFKKLCETFHGYKRKPQKNHKTTTPAKYIAHINNRYTIRKNINSKTRIFGTYDRLEDAIIMRDALEEDGWHQTHVDKLCEELGVKRRKGYFNEKVRYH